MNTELHTTRGDIPERAIIAAGITPNEESTYKESLDELRELLRTAMVAVSSEMIQRVPHKGMAGYLGKGKLEELAAVVKENNAHLVVFDDELKPSQAKNIEKVVECRVVDRTEVILSIFALHAQTNEAKVQVELAQLEYSAPRLKHRWSHLWGQTGGYAIGMRGPGEKQLEMDRRALRKRMTELKRELAHIQSHRSRVASVRPEGFTVSLVGYTNSGKSTILNALTGSDVLTEDMLFSTLGTRTRLLKLDGGLKTFLSDTVGFIRKLPTHLIASFYATLEETRRAKLLLHVIDASHPAAVRHIEAVNSVLASIGCDKKNVLSVFNKMDKVSDFDSLLLKTEFPNAVFISAAEGWNLEELVGRVKEVLLEDALNVTVKVPLSCGGLLSDILEGGFALNTIYEGSFAHVELLIPKEELGRIMRRGALAAEED